MTHSNIRSDGPARIDFEAAMTPAERALVAEFDVLDALMQAGQLPDEKQTRWYLLARAVDGIWYRAAMGKVSGAQD